MYSDFPTDAVLLVNQKNSIITHEVSLFKSITLIHSPWLAMNANKLFSILLWIVGYHVVILLSVSSALVFLAVEINGWRMLTFSLLITTIPSKSLVCCCWTSKLFLLLLAHPVKDPVNRISRHIKNTWPSRLELRHVPNHVLDHEWCPYMVWYALVLIPVLYMIVFGYTRMFIHKYMFYWMLLN